MEIKALPSKAYPREGEFRARPSVQADVGDDLSARSCMANMIMGRFGWTNASYVYGLSLLGLHAKRALGVQAPYEVYAKALTAIRD